MTFWRVYNRQWLHAGSPKRGFGCGYAAPGYSRLPLFGTLTKGEIHACGSSGGANHEPVGSRIDRENAANHAPATEDGHSCPSLESPRTDTSALPMKVTGEGTEPTPVKFSGQRSRDRGAKRLPGIAERQLGILNRSAFPDAELALGDPRAPARPIAFGNFRGGAGVT